MNGEIKLKKLVWDAWRTYLQISSLKFSIDFRFSFEKADKIHYLENKAYQRYKRRLTHWENSPLHHADKIQPKKIERRQIERRKNPPEYRTAGRQKGVNKRRLRECV
ncbi:MAG: hypothetical protein ACXWFG_15885 [Methylobacter sp.]